MAKSNYEMIEEVKIMVEMFIDDFNKNTGYKIDIPSVKFTLRGRAAGMHICREFEKESSLNFNLGIMKENYDDFIFQTVGHEVAHHICYCLFGVERTRGKYGKLGKRIAHGSNWKNVMHSLNLDAKRCHSYQLPEEMKKKTFTYECNCTTWQLSKIRHNKMLKGTAQYGCPKCKTSLKQK